MNTEWSLDLAKTNRAWEGLSDLCCEAYDNAYEHGFHDAHNTLRAICAENGVEELADITIRLEMLAKIGSEVGEAVSAVQHGDEEAMHEELADIIIRVLDMAGALNINLASHVIAKMQKNRTRPYLHGKKC